MIVKRIVTNIAAPDISKARQFYGEILGLEITMDLGWIATFQSAEPMMPQVTIATEGGSGTEVPDISIEVDDLDEALRRVLKAELTIEYGPASEAWGVRRFYVRDPFGRLVNILSHGRTLKPLPEHHRQRTSDHNSRARSSHKQRKE